MRHLYWKEDLEAQCPYCDDVADHTFYLNSETLICHRCDKEFDIALYVGAIEVRSTKMED